MLSALCSLFENYGFKATQVNNGHFFAPGLARHEEEYWLVIKENVEELNKNQEALFQHCKKLCADKALDKNLSLLVLWETDGNVPIQALKEKIMRIEEDPYYFKKYVLYYSKQELSDFLSQMDSIPMADFVTNKIASREIFDVYKQKPYVQTWQSLLYRLVIKIPFLRIPIQESAGLQSLFEINKTEIELKGMTEFNVRLIEAISKVSMDEDKEYSSDELFNELWPLIKGADSVD
jgi:hypothetical protein